MRMTMRRVEGRGKIDAILTGHNAVLGTSYGLKSMVAIVVKLWSIDVWKDHVQLAIAGNTANIGHRKRKGTIPKRAGNEVRPLKEDRRAASQV